MAKAYVGAKKIKCCLCKEQGRYEDMLHLPTGWYKPFTGEIIEGWRKSFCLRCYIIWSTLVENLRASGRFNQMSHAPIDILPLVKLQSDEVKQCLSDEGFIKLVRNAEAI